jgi:CheY-specific phosphatase CheX
MHNDEWKQLHELVVSASNRVFASAGFHAEYAGAVPLSSAQWDDAVSIIGLGGSRLRGSLVLSVPRDLLARTHPTQGTEGADLADWLAELANLLLGRIKALLVAHGVTIELSTPITISAADLRFVRFKTTPVVHRFEVQGQALHVVLEAVADDEARFTRAREAAVLEAGEMVTF